MTDFSVTYNSLTITLGNLTTNGIEIDRISGIDGLGIRVSENVLTGQDGGIIWNRLYDMRNIVFEGWLVTADDTLDGYWNAKRTLVNAFSITENTDLSITRWSETSTTRVITAKIIESPMIVENPGEVDHCRWRVELKCDDPMFGDETATDYSMALATGGGSPVAFSVPTPVGALSGGVVTINNEGDVTAYPELIKIDGLVVNPTITNSTTGKSFQIGTTITSGNYVQIYRNQQGEFILYNGSANYYEYFTGDIFKLAKGTNTLRFTASSGSGALATITWRDRFLTL